MKIIPVCLSRRLRASILAALLATATCLISSGAAAADKTDATESESTAWSALELAIKPKQPPAWREKPPSETEYKGYMLRQADVALERVTGYLVKFPGGAHASEARSLQRNILTSAAALGDKAREKELFKLLSAQARDPALPANDRVAARVMQVNMDAQKLGGADRNASIKLLGDSLLAIQKDFPRSEQPYFELINLANQVSGPTLDPILKVVAGSPDAPATLKQRAKDILDGKVFHAPSNIGKPVPIKFTGLDGTEVDLAKMKGKVVLVDFWAMWCGPCIAELPRLKATYEKYHAKGFEIVGISFDREGDKEKLTKFTKDKGMPWPQYFDGKMWSNDFGKRFGIESIPTMWLFDKSGNLADAVAAELLDEKVAYLLNQK